MRSRASLREPGVPRINIRDLTIVTVMGQIAHPVGRPSPYRVGHDGVVRVLPGSGGIAINRRIGDRCVGLAGDHIEPGVSLHNNDREVVGPRNGPNLALLTYACVGNVARVVTGPCRGKRGIVTGKHGGVEHLLVDFSTKVLRRLRIGDRIQVYSVGLGMRLLDHPSIEVMSCSPRLIRRWGLRSQPPKLRVPVTHLIPASIMGSGIGRPDSVRGDYDIQLFDPAIRRQFRLGSLRFGDLVGIIHSDSRFGRAYRRGSITIGVVVHGDSTVSGHGPGVVSLLTSVDGNIEPLLDSRANLAAIFSVRALPPARMRRPLVRAREAPPLRVRLPLDPSAQRPAVRRDET
jgi:uncharacterized protein DUF4438